jgi:hypothetical protein
MKYTVLFACVALAACGGPGKPDYDAQARCQGLGYKAGTTAYDQCVKDEVASKMLKQQREEFERMKQDREDIRRYQQY